jgi:DNA-binding PadR family transcriptional regulator
MAKENKTKYAILGVLSVRPGSGYDIKKFCDSSIAHFWNENYGHIYPVLNQLEKDGWVEKTTEINKSKLKNIYNITKLGEEKLIEWLSISPEAPQARYEFLLKMFFSQHISADIVLERLEKSIEYCNIMLERYKDIEKRSKEKMTESACCDSGITYRHLTLRYGILNTEASLKWCEESIEFLKKFIKKEEIK